jgi:hypothetical protein
LCSVFVIKCLPAAHPVAAAVERHALIRVIIAVIVSIAATIHRMIPVVVLAWNVPSDGINRGVVGIGSISYKIHVIVITVNIRPVIVVTIVIVIIIIVNAAIII